ncbi:MULTISPECIES: hypothetical protein [Mycolicibacterium]|uniref:Secreted protein n=2 Tax=Mycolicibacterium TaxID=1866885 RepID=A1T9E8_MYCVP|nr:MULTISPECIES: hypothetical protein [Mycolicibacterium]ABM13798.1 conserved hypothetical protein [Mycolicibacterium vanbaalenii PYR-1]MDN4518863.1 hypothetical protein [Mycolicibacterium austroafricanum]
MRARIALAAAAVAVSGLGVAPGGAGVALAQPDVSAGTVTAPFSQTWRRCDFSKFAYTGPRAYGRLVGQFRVEAGELVADLQMATGVPNTPYDVRVIQLPRSSAESCHAGAPGVLAGTLFTDAAGSGAVTVRGPIASGATGVWASVTRPSPFSHTPAEFYTTDFILSL